MSTPGNNKCKFGCESLNTVCYALIAICLYLISLSFIINEYKLLIFSIEYDLSIKLAENLFERKNETNILAIKSKNFIINQFATSIIFLIFSFLFMLIFAFVSFFKFGYSINNNIRLGRDFVLIKPCKLFSSKKGEYSFNNNNNTTSSPITSSTTSFLPSSNISTTTDEILSSISVSCCSAKSSPVLSSSSSFASASTSSTSSTADRVNSSIDKSISQFSFYLPPINSCLHMIMCFCFLMSRLNLEKFKLTNDLFTYNQQYDKYRKNKLNATLLVKRLLHIKYGNTSRSKLYEFINFGLELANTLKLDLNYFNYIIGFIVFLIQFTRIHSSMNKYYSFVIFTHLSLFTISSLTSYCSFENIFKSNLIKLTSKIASNDELKILIKVNTTYLNNNAIRTSTPSKYTPDLFNNESFLISCYVISWLLNLVYLSSLNAFATTFYMRQFGKLRFKFEFFLNKRNKNISIIQMEHDKGIKSYFKKEKYKYKENNTLEIQYKIIITGIVILLLIEIFRIPFLYLCFCKYLFSSSEIYLVTLLFELIYLVFNSFIWILFSFKTKWRVHFSSKFRVLLWNKMSLDLVEEERINNNARINSQSEILSKSLENLIRKKSINQNLYVKKEQSNKLNPKSYGTKAQDNVTSFKNINK